MKLLSAKKVKSVTNLLTCAENHAMKRKTVLDTNRPVTQTQAFVLKVRTTTYIQ